MDMGTMMRRLAEDMADDTPDIPCTVEQIKAAATFYDGRGFKPGDVIRKRSDDQDFGEGGRCNYRIPVRGEPCLVMEIIKEGQRSDGSFDHEDTVVLARTGKGFIRLVIDPVYFELFE